MPACEGRLWLTLGGQVIGIAPGAALLLASARGCNLAVASELLPVAEAGLGGALNSQPE